MAKKEMNWYNVLLIIVIIIALGFLFFQNTLFNNVLSITEAPDVFRITGHATTGNTTSNVTIQKYLSMTFCANLTEGVLFGSIESLPVTDLNATHNYDGAEDNNSTFCVNVSDDGNTGIDLCLKGFDDLTSVGSDIIGIQNETYSNYTNTNNTHPLLASQTAITTTYQKTGLNIPVGSPNYYRFWLDIPGAQPSGTYNNTLMFKGVQTATACT